MNLPGSPSLQARKNQMVIPLAELIEDSNPLKGLDLTSTGNIISEKDVVDNNKRFYCMDCSKFIEDEDVNCDSNDYPVSHNNGRNHRVLFSTDVQLLLELGTSWLGQSTRYEIAEMYGISVQQLDQILASRR